MHLMPNSTSNNENTSEPIRDVTVLVLEDGSNLSVDQLHNSIQENRISSANFNHCISTYNTDNNTNDQLTTQQSLVDYFNIMYNLIITTCDDCHLFVPVASGYHFRMNDNILCMDCRDNYRWSEEICEHVHVADWDEDYHGEGNNDDDDRANLLDYYSASPLHLGFKLLPTEHKINTTTFLGVELEVETRSTSNLPNAINAIKNATSSFAICKEDSSLSSRGFEICTAPGTLKYHKSGIWDKFFKMAPNHVYSYSSSTCGMHVHMSISSITPLTLGKMIMMMNTKKNWDMLSTIAGRTIYQGTEWCSATADINDTLKGAKHRSDRYSTLNTNTGKDTVEFRIFKGNLKPLTFFKNLEFCTALRDYCAQETMPALSFDNFWQWVKTPRNSNNYAHLLYWADQHNIISNNYNTRSTLHTLPSLNNTFSPTSDSNTPFVAE